MTNVKNILSYGWSLISDGSQEENKLCFMWIGLNIFALSMYVMTKLIGA